MSFAKLPLKPEILEVVAELGYDQMTPIQAQAIPVLLEGRDLIGQSQTGSGKTAAFAIPLLQKIDVRNRELQALIIAPTRELCTQVAREIRRLGRRLPRLEVAVICGGQPLYPQLDALRRGAHIVVGTPGRLVDIIHKGRFDAAGIRTLVLDEADRMLDMGFEDDMKVIVGEMPRDRQTVLFSATYPPEIQSLSKNFQNKPAIVTIESKPESKPDIHQTYFEVEDAEKPLFLMRLLRRYDPDAALIFANLKATVAQLGETLKHEGFSVETLHGDLEQRDRDEVLAKFRNGSVRYVIATDVAARGLDIESLPLVVNYDLPHETEVFTHRVGRTGRAGAVGEAISLVAAHDRVKMREVEKSGMVVEEGRLPKAEGPAYPRMSDKRTIFIAGGRKDKVRPTDLLGALTGESGGLQGADVGKIEIHDRFSYVAVSRPVAQKAYKSLSAGRIKGQRFFIKLLT